MWKAWNNEFLPPNETKDTKKDQDNGVVSSSMPKMSEKSDWWLESSYKKSF